MLTSFRNSTLFSSRYFKTASLPNKVAVVSTLDKLVPSDIKPLSLLLFSSNSLYLAQKTYLKYKFVGDKSFRQLLTFRLNLLCYSSKYLIPITILRALSTVKIQGSIIHNVIFAI